MMPAEMFDSPTHRKVLRVFAEKNRMYTSDELAEMSNRAKSTVSRVLKSSEKYPCIRVDTVSGSKERLYGLDAQSEYAEPIREFFRIERRRERQNGTVPVDVWNLLEDITVTLEGKIDSFVEVYLFGSFASGEYYAGSDIDLIVVYDETHDVANPDDMNVLEESDVRPLVEKKLPSERAVDLLVTGVKWNSLLVSDTNLESRVREVVPIGDGEPLVPLWRDDR